MGEVMPVDNCSGTLCSGSAQQDVQQDVWLVEVVQLPSERWVEQQVEH